jgi:hypothetical protein
MKKSIINRLTDFCKETSSNNNTLTEQENETLLVLMRKCISPSPDYCNAVTEEQMDKAKVFLNSIDDGFGDASAEILAETCTTLATDLGRLIAVELSVLMTNDKVNEPSMEMVSKAMSDVCTKHGFIPDLTSKPILLGLFVFSTIEDPLVAMLNANRCIDIGEKMIQDSLKISASITHELMNP